VEGHDFGRRQTLLCIYIRKYFVVPAKQGSSGPCVHCRKPKCEVTVYLCCELAWEKLCIQSEELGPGGNKEMSSVFAVLSSIETTPYGLNEPLTWLCLH
jgi:hypothetical protein